MAGVTAALRVPYEQSIANVLAKTTSEKAAYGAVRKLRRSATSASHDELRLPVLDPKHNYHDIVRFRPAAAAAVPHRVVIDAKHEAVRVTAEALHQLDEMRESLTFAGERISLLAAEHGVALPKELQHPGGIRISPFADISDSANVHAGLAKLEAAFTKKVGNNADALQKFAADKNDLIGLHRFAPQYLQKYQNATAAAETLQKLGWGTRSKTQALLAKMLSKEARAYISPVLFTTAFLLACGLPPAIAEAVQKKRKAKHVAALAKMTSVSSPN